MGNDKEQAQSANEDRDNGQMQRGVMCHCKRCEQPFEAWEDMGEIESNICQLCNFDEVDQMCWERDSFD